MVDLKYQHLRGITFKHGSDDCYGIIRRFYWDNFGIALTNYARPTYWWHEGLDLYNQHFADEGFYVVGTDLKDLKPADVLLVAVDTEDPCHAGIYLGQNQVLHHYWARFSDTTPLKGVWNNNLCKILRHKDVPDLTPQATQADLFDYLLPEKRAKLEAYLDQTE